MLARERLHATFTRQTVDRPPVALWRHFPGDDLDPRRLAAQVVDFQRTYDFDFVKVTPAGSYSAEMYGGVLAVDPGNLEGARKHVARAVNQVSDWEKIGVLDTSNPVFRRERTAMQQIRAGLGPDVPILQTIFTPLSVASRLAGERFWGDLREQPAVIHRALEQITVTVQRFALDALAAGADAFFLATQVATRSLLSPAELATFARPYDLALLEALRGKADFVLLHVHGEDIYFEEMAAYPVQAINWHDRRTPPSLAEGMSKFGGAVVGGLDDDLLLHGAPHQVRAQVEDAIQQRQGVGLIVAAGCVTLTGTPEANLRAVRDAVDR